jgi:hypothetical protein
MIFSTKQLNLNEYINKRLEVKLDWKEILAKVPLL